MTSDHLTTVGLTVLKHHFIIVLFFFRQMISKVTNLRNVYSIISDCCHHICQMSRFSLSLSRSSWENIWLQSLVCWIFQIKSIFNQNHVVLSYLVRFLCWSLCWHIQFSKLWSSKSRFTATTVRTFNGIHHVSFEEEGLMTQIEMISVFFFNNVLFFVGLSRFKPFFYKKKNLNRSNHLFYDFQIEW